MNFVDVRSSAARLGALSLFGALLTSTAFAACTGTSPSIVCTSSNSSAIDLSSTAGASHAVPATASAYPSTAVVSGLVGTISSVQVRLNGLTHNRLHDVDMLLVSPTGIPYVFWSDIGDAGGTTPNAVTNFTVTLNDTAAAALPQGTPSASSYRPKNYETIASSPDVFPSAGVTTGVANSASPVGTQTFATRFNGADPNGTWRLYISIAAGADVGSLASWDLILGVDPSTSVTTTSLTSTANPVVIPLSGNSQTTITASVTSGGNPVTLGAVTFFNGSQTLAPNVPLNSSGQASFTLNTTSGLPLLPEGSYNITANYSGATGFGNSTGNLTQVVDRATQITGNTFCNTGKITIPQAVAGASVYPSKLFVTGLSGITQSVVMGIKGFTNPAPNDVNMLLVSPTGQTFVPFAYISDVVSSQTAGANITLDDLSANSLPNSGAIATGTYSPSHGLNGASVSPVTFVPPAPTGSYNSPAPGGSATFASTFGGVSPNGTWTLYAYNWANTAGAGLREITNGWCLTIGTSSDPATTTTISASPTPSALNQSTTISAQVNQVSNGSPVNTQGAVTFKAGSITLAGPVLVDSLGSASFVKSDLPQGAHFLDALYSGVPGLVGPSNGQVLHYVDSGTTNPTAGRFCNATALTFPNTVNATGAPYPTRITASGLAGTISKVTIDLLGFTHQFPDDLDLMVTGPNGNSLIAFSDVGGSNVISTPLNITLDSTASSVLPDSTTLSGGTFRPADFEVGVDTFAAPAPTTNVFSGSATSLGLAFNNSNPNGIWTLWPRTDNAGVQGGGSLANGWCINVSLNQPQLTISKTHSGNFTQGQTGAQYTIIVGSNGPGPTAGTISVVDNVPGGLTVTGMSGNGWTCTVNTRTCTTAAILAANGTLPPITVTVDVAPNANSPLTNNATVSGGGATSSFANDSTIITPLADLTISKTTSSTFVQGGQASYTLSVSNVGAGSTSGAYTVSDNLPTGLTLVSIISGSDWSCSASTSTFVSCVSTSVLAPNAAASPITVNVNISSTTASSISNTATVAGGGQLNTNNDSSFVNSTVNPAPPDLTVTKTTQGTGPFLRGSAVNFFLTVNNISGSSASTGTVTVTDTLPFGLSVAAISAPAWNCSSASETVTCTRASSIAPNSSAPAISILAGISAGALASITNTATVSGGGQTNTSNDGGSITIDTIPPADLRISKTANGPFTQGGSASYTITLTNIGTGATTRVYTVTDSIPSDLSAGLVTSPDSGWNCTSSTATSVNCSRTTALAPGASTTLNIPVTISPTAAASITNIATVTNAGELFTDNNNAISIVSVGAAPTNVTISVPAGITYTFNGQSYTGSQTIPIAPGTYPLATTTTQPLGAGTQAVFSSWSDGQPATHNVTVGASPLTITGTFTTQYQLTTAASPSNGGTVTPVSGTFYDAGTVVNLSATDNSGFAFASWTGPVANANTAATTVTMDAPKSVSANFFSQTVVIINVPAGITFAFNGQGFTGSQTITIAPGSYPLTTFSPQPLGAGTQAVFSSWSDGLPITHNVTVGSSAITITGNFTTQYLLTLAANPSNGGTVTPATGTFYNSGTVVNLAATPNSGFLFANWSGPVANPASASTTVTMDAAKSVTANFTAQTGVTISVPAGISYNFNGQTVTGTQTFQVAPGSYSLSTTATQTLGVGIRAQFNTWSDTPALTRSVTVGPSALTITGNFTTQYQLTLAANPSNGGTVTPASGTYYDAGTVVNLSATPNSGFLFANWSGPVANANAASTTVTMDAAKSVTANFTAQTGVTINVPAGISYSFNGQTVTGTQTFQVAPGTYPLSTTTPQNLGAGTQAVFSTWSDGLPIAHNVTVGSSAITVTGNFTTQYLLTLAASPSNGGTVTPATGTFYNSGTVVNLAATPNSGFIFANWSGPVANANAASTTVTMDAAKSVTANFTAQTGVTISVPAGITYSFNGQSVTGSQTFNVAPGTYVLSTTTPQNLGAGTQAVFSNWSDGLPISHNVTVGSSAITITGNFTTQYQLTLAASPTNGGTVTPATGTFYNSGTVVNLAATPNSGFLFANWTGAVANANAAATTVTMDAAKSVTANFTAQTGVTISVPAGITYSFNGQSVTGSQTFQVAPGTYVLSTTSPQTLGVGTQAVFSTWSDNAALSRNVVVGSSPLTITGTFTTQYRLTTAASPSNGGTVTPASGTFYNSGTVVNLAATPNSGFIFANWTGAVANANSASTTVTMDAAKSVTANFTAQTGVTISVPAGISYNFNGQTVTGTQTFQVAPGTYVLSTTTPQTLGAGTQAVFSNWSDGLPISHNVTVGSSPLTITGNFTTQYQLTLAASPSNGGTVTPATGTFYNSGTVVNLAATPNSGFIFANWSGAVANANAAATTVTMNAPQSVTANFNQLTPAPVVTPQVTITRTVPAFNRATGRYLQQVTITNNGLALAASALVFDALDPNYAVFQPSGVTTIATPAGVPYKEAGPIGAGQSVTVTVEFTRSAVASLTYTPRVLGAGTR